MLCCLNFQLPFNSPIWYFDRNVEMLFDAMLEASNPVAVLAWMKELGKDPGLIVIISLKTSRTTKCCCRFHALLCGGPR